MGGNGKTYIEFPGGSWDELSKEIRDGILSQMNDNEYQGPERRSGWAQYQMFVLRELERLSQAIRDSDQKREDQIDDIHSRLNSISTDVSKLSERSMIWWGIGAVICSSVISIAIEMWAKK